MKTFCKDCLPSRSVHRPVHKSVLTMSTAAHYAIWRAQLIALKNLWPHRWQERATVKHCGKEPWKPREGRGTLLGTEDERTVWTETGFELQPEASEAVNHVEREDMSGIIIQDTDSGRWRHMSGTISRSCMAALYRAWWVWLEKNLEWRAPECCIEECGRQASKPSLVPSRRQILKSPVKLNSMAVTTGKFMVSFLN